MSYKIVHQMLPSSKYSLKSPYSMSPKGICVHNTANDAPSVNEVSYMNSNSNQVSFHAAVDDKEVRIAIPYTRNAFAAGDGKNGDGNRRYIHIEICYSKSGGSRYVQSEENAVQYIAALLKQYDWGVEKVKKHQDFSGKFCPHRILSEKRWSSFISRIQKALDGLNKKAPVVVKQKEKSGSTWRIKTGVFKTKALAQSTLDRIIRRKHISVGYVVNENGWRIKTGTFSDEARAKQVLSVLKKEQFFSTGYVIET